MILTGSAKMLGRLKSAREISISLGYPEPPAPGGLIPTSSFSFTAESARQNKGVVFGRRMKSVEEINREHAVGSGPGGSCRVPSFVHDAAVENKGEPPRLMRDCGHCRAVGPSQATCGMAVC